VSSSFGEFGEAVRRVAVLVVFALFRHAARVLTVLLHVLC
jgi:hypothetical protein